MPPPSTFAAGTRTRGLPELTWLEQLIDSAPCGVVTRTLCEVEANGHNMPVHAICLGNPDRSVPAIGFFGGVHGLERIGTQVLLHFLEELFARIETDVAFNFRLEHMRLVFMPLVNPGGMLGGTRCNPRGVDLMRNSPVDATSKVPFLLGGQRLSPHLPWFRGSPGSSMEGESHALCRLVEDELLGRRFAAALDCHSGFGFRDRIWFPYAHTPQPIHHLPELHALTALFERHYPEHDYVIEPQSRQYLAHGDLWDHLYQRSLTNEDNVFLPLTLEMGSWRWISKFPRQLFSRLGMFNPLPTGRRERVLRNHLPWLDFLTRMAGDCAQWLPAGAARQTHARDALARWYPAAPELMP